MNAKMHVRVNKYEITRGFWKRVDVPTIMYRAEMIDIEQKRCKDYK